MEESSTNAGNSDIKKKKAKPAAVSEKLFLAILPKMYVIKVSSRCEHS